MGNRHTKLFHKENAESPYIFHHSIRGQNKDIEVLSRTFAMSGAPFLFSINHNAVFFFFATNPQALPLQKAFFWFKDTLEVIFPDQPLQESRIMSHDIVRRDEIWIADKNEDDNTKLFSLEDEQVRIDKVLDQNYMDNVWGGVPVFEDEEVK